MVLPICKYYRLSVEDIDLQRKVAKDESNSISAQRLLIEGYISESDALRNLPQLEFYDDGFSGTNFARPGFEQMIDLAKQGKIGCIIVKDLSRFGRSYIEVGDYLEHIFPFLGIRFISINDHYDSENYDGKTAGLDVTFRNLIYDYYSKDLSVKVKSAMRLKQEKAGYVTCCPYGYKRSKDVKHKMEIDEPAAMIVREIFDSVIAGKSTSEIAAELNHRSVPTPQEHKGTRRVSPTVPRWTHPCIVSILRNIKYTGVMTNHTRESRRIRDSNQRRVAESEWFIHPDAHEPIIPREKWDQANAILRNPKKTQKAAHNDPDRVYYCAHCGRKLYKTHGAEQYYYCVSSRYHTNDACSNIRLKRSEIEPVLLEALKVQISIMEDSQRTKRKKQHSTSADCYKRIAEIEKEMARCKTQKLDQYESYRAEKISRDDFIQIKANLAAKEEELSVKKQLLEQEYQTLLQSQKQEETVDADLQKAKQSLADTAGGLREHLYEAIDRVIVTDNEKIEIKWTFADAVSPLLTA